MPIDSYRYSNRITKSQNWHEARHDKQNNSLAKSDSEEKLAGLEHVQHLMSRIMPVIDRLPWRESCVIKMRFGLDGGGPCKLREISEVLGVCKERARQLVDKAIAMIKGAV